MKEQWYAGYNFGITLILLLKINAAIKHFNYMNVRCFINIFQLNVFFTVWEHKFQPIKTAYTEDIVYVNQKCSQIKLY